MTNRVLNGWLIHCQPIGEYDHYLHLLTQEQGLIKIRYPGGQSRKRKPHVQLFTALWIEVKQTNHNQYCVNIESKHGVKLLVDLPLSCAYYVTELIYKILKQPDADNDLYHAYEQTIQTLHSSKQTKHHIERLLRRFEWTLLVSQGHAYSFQYEGDHATELKPDICYEFKPGYGFYANHTGLSGKTLLTISQEGLAQEDSLKAAKLIMRLAIDHLVDYAPIYARNLLLGRPAAFLTTKQV